MNERIKTSIYAYVSNDFSGKNVRLSSGGKNYNGNWASFYNIEKKGTWQHLIINNWGIANSEYYAGAYLDNPGSKDFSNFQGHVIFASPTFKVMNNDPRDPETYTSSTYEREYPLVGSNSGIVPAGVAGARYTNKTEGRQWKDQYHSTTEYWSVMANAGDSVFASVYCYVSPDFNGSEVRLELRGKLKGQTVSRYNLSTRGQWVLLEAKAVATENGRASGVYMFSQKGVTDFSSLTGYVTFAYPQLVVKPQTLSLVQRANRPQYAAWPFSLNSFATDSIADSFELSMANDHFAGPRIDRWRYAWYIFKNEYSPIQKLTGGGFGYTVMFARKFHPEDPLRDYDYPHNPFLSVLLYSGLIGLILYIWFFTRTVYLYYVYLKEYWLLGVVYAISFFYSFFSANSPFEPAFFGVMGVLPYFIHYIRSSEVKH